MTTKRIVQVWDPLVRIGHWFLVLAFFTAYLTEDDFLTPHVWAGYGVGGYLLLRLIWGLMGPKNARFSSFVYKPAQIIAYLQKLWLRQPQHYIGHNPAGGAMVIALLLCLSATVLSGLQLYAVAEHKGPLVPFQQQLARIQPLSMTLIANAHAQDDDDDAQDAAKPAALSKNQADDAAAEFWEELHELCANLTVLLVLLHVAGVMLSSRIDQEALVKTMITGKKEIDDRYQ